MTYSVAEWQNDFDWADHSERGDLVCVAPDELDDATYWRAVADAWQDSDRQPLGPTDWRKLFMADRPKRELLMSADERTKLAALPERVEIYRGVNARNAMSGLSWTLDLRAGRMVRPALPVYGMAGRRVRRACPAPPDHRSIR